MLQDNLARDDIIKNPDLKPIKAHELSPADNNVNMSNVETYKTLSSKVSLIRKKIDAWLDIRISLELKKLFSKLTVKDAKKIAEDTKKTFADEGVSREIDEHLDKMINESKKLEENKSIEDNNSKPDLIVHTNENYQDKPETKAPQLTKVDGHFNSGNNANAA